MTDPFVGQLIFFRVYSGVVNSGDTVYNAVKEKKERLGRILQMHANERKEIKEVYAGDIAAAVGLKEATTGDTLCDPNHVIILERMIFPEPVISQAVEPKTKVDQEKMGIALNRLAQEDPSFRVQTDEESGQTIISGMGELHLEILVDRMKREFGVEATVGKPQVAYRETIRIPVEDVEGKFVKQSGGRGQYGHVGAQAGAGSSRARATNSSMRSRAASMPREYIPAVDKGIQETLKAGVLAGYPVVDVKVTLTFGSYHDVDSNENAFRMAGSMAFKDGMRKAKPVLLEPMMAVEVETPEDFMGNVMGDLSSRARHRAGHGRHRGWRRQAGARRSAAGGDVRLLDLAALAHARPRDLHDGVQALRRNAEQRRGSDRELEVEISFVLFERVNVRTRSVVCPCFTSGRNGLFLSAASDDARKGDDDER